MVTVRPARPEEAAEIRAVGRASWHAAYDSILGPDTVDERVDEWWALDDLRESADDESVFLVAEDDGLVGVGHALPDDTGTWVLGRLYVVPGRWGEGIGTRLLDAVLDRLPADAERLWLVVLADNDVGVSFYESRGFELVRERADEDAVDEGVRELEYELAL